MGLVMSMDTTQTSRIEADRSFRTYLRRCALEDLKGASFLRLLRFAISEGLLDEALEDARTLPIEEDIRWLRTKELIEPVSPHRVARSEQRACPHGLKSEIA